MKKIIKVNGIATVAEEVYGLGASNDSSDCIICMSEKIDVIVLPCNHMCICYNCCVDFRAKNKKCPICRARIYCVFFIIILFLAIDSFVKMEIANQNKPQIPNLQPCNPYQK